MKAILVIDMPNICYKCPCYDHEGGICQATSNWKTDREDGCPLRPLPQKREPKEEWLNEYHRDEFADGWNACLDAITGEKDGL